MPKIHFSPIGKRSRATYISGISFVLLFSLLLYIYPAPLRNGLDFLENISYDLKVRYSSKPKMSWDAVVIVDIDDASLEAEGNWAWPRDKLGHLLDELFRLNAKVVAFDIIFPDIEKNILGEVISKLNATSPQIVSELEKEKENFDYSKVFAHSLEQGNSILGFAFVNEADKHVGKLPAPLIDLSSTIGVRLDISSKPGFISNLPILQESAKGGGFLNSSVDPDGVVRSSHLLYRYNEGLYSSLSFEAVRHFLEIEKVELITKKYTSGLALEGIKLIPDPSNKVMTEPLHIPTDPFGSIVIPFIGPSHSVPYVSATKVLNRTVEKKEIENKLIIVGSSATAMGDLVSTPIAPIFFGVEVHAQIALAIINNYLPYKPTWGKGVSTLLVFLLGMICALYLPRMGAVGMTVFSLSLTLGIFLVNQLIWNFSHIIFSVVFPTITILFVYVLNLAAGYFIKTRREEKIRNIFGQYVPPEFVDSMLVQGGTFGLEGKTQELTVLFADIRGFTALSEKMTAEELKRFLNDFFDPMTQVIFDYKGTIDKYVGDMVMAFWGAPLDDPQSPYHAVQAALSMQEKLRSLNVIRRQNGGADVQMGIGLNTGMMNVGDMGSQFRRAYTVIGEAVNLASRYESLCRFYNVGVIVGEETFKKTEGQFAYRKIDRVQVKGVEKATNIYEPLALKENASGQIIDLLSQHQLAMDAYLHRDWATAETLFTQLLSSYPGSETLYQIFIDRIAHFKQIPPTPNWDGTYVMERK